MINDLSYNKHLFFLLIDCYLDLIVQRGIKNYSKVKIHAFNTKFWTIYERDGYDKVKKWTKGVNIFEKDALFIPMHFGDHWAVTIIDFRARRACCFDSLGVDRSKHMPKVMEYLQFEQNERNKNEYDLSSIQTVNSQKAAGECVENFLDLLIN